ncbi:MAG: DNA primase [Smithellaceae bacterium]|nr:DNA primase [Syntrophaceae bacterium]MDD4241813.1 DNA primase [Smithellaceae bacterium]NLX53170.1 DNA primase [Deltaproteobacteria bacterium]
MRFDDSKIEEIKSRVDIVELASEYLTLRKAGRNYVGLCPFHQEKTPSFTVNREKQMFYCFGCGEGGNAITLLMKIADKSFPEAIKLLAEKTGVLLPARTFGSDGAGKDSLHDDIVHLNLRAAQHFARQLSSPAGKIARDYLQKRAVTEETVREFRLGYVPDDWRSLTDLIEASGLSLKLAEQAGLVIAGKEGSYYDRFRGRLIFPIENIFGEVIAFGGRILGEGEPKYLNSPESPVYVKGRHLYGLGKARQAIRESGYCLLVEGYFDAISLWNAGVRNVVATLGTALTREHLDLLRRYTQNAVALFDPDTAGRKALDRSLELFLGANMHARALVLPDGYDPDDFIKKFGREKLEERIAVAPSISDYYIDCVLGEGKTFEENRDLAKTAMEFVGKIGDEIEKNLFLKRIAEKLGIDQTVLKREIHRKGGTPQPKNAGPGRPAGVAFHPLEMNLIRLMLDFPRKTLLVESEKALDFFLEPALREAGEKIVKAYRLLEYVDINVILPSDGDRPLREALNKLRIETTTDEDRVDRNFSDNIRRIRERWYKEQKRLLQLQLRQAQEQGDGERIAELTCRKQNLIKEEQALR